ncbi:hypothetical protein KIPB_005959 [Kipferlia bialata]|uniref:Eukaryotic translation initiation factor 3 subunit C N-terminal domain-containing protein n=1 Tax=Kipferlia bialata TaxID=797122 RepID=A0A9K3GJD8_9EUKA|nr:hypothetical protein KIPB_005959 [Kipferlia bialata]|eukprot:g5959.t1
MAHSVLVLSKVSESVSLSSIRCQLLHNRAIVAIGLGALSLGDTRGCYTALETLCGSQQRLRSLLGDDRISSESCDTPDLLQLRARPPAHATISPELVDASYFLACIYKDAPKMAIHTHYQVYICTYIYVCAQGSAASDTARVGLLSVSKGFRRALTDVYSYVSPFARPDEVSVGYPFPGDSARSGVVSTFASMLQGRDKEAMQILQSIGVWKQLPIGVIKDQFLKAETAMVALRCKMASLVPAVTTIDPKTLVGPWTLEEVRAALSVIVSVDSLPYLWDADGCLVRDREPESRLVRVLELVSTSVQ